MDSFADFAGLITAMTMIWLGALVARSAWRELAAQAPPRPVRVAEPPPGDVWLPFAGE